MLSLLTNLAQFKRVLQALAVIPAILRFVEIVEAKDASGAVKRQLVVDMTTTTANELTKRGYLPDDAHDGLPKVAGEITDTVVNIYNAVGHFSHKPKEPSDGNKSPGIQSQ